MGSSSTADEAMRVVVSKVHLLNCAHMAVPHTCIVFCSVDSLGQFGFVVGEHVSLHCKIIKILLRIFGVLARSRSQWGSLRGIVIDGEGSEDKNEVEGSLFPGIGRSSDRS